MNKLDSTKAITKLEAINEQESSITQLGCLHLFADAEVSGFVDGGADHLQLQTRNCYRWWSLQMSEFSINRYKDQKQNKFLTNPSKTKRSDWISHDFMISETNTKIEN